MERARVVRVLGPDVNGARVPSSGRDQILSLPATAIIDGPMRNIDAWYDAWGVKPTDKLYLKPEDRVRIW